MATLPVTGAELDDVRQYAIGTLALSIATQAGLASTLSALIGVGLGLDWLREHPRRLAAVTRRGRLRRRPAATWRRPGWSPSWSGQAAGLAGRCRRWARSSATDVGRVWTGTGRPEVGLRRCPEEPTLSRSGHDRAAERRDDAAWLAAAWQRARVLVVDAGRTRRRWRRPDGPRLACGRASGAAATPSATSWARHGDGAAVRRPRAAGPARRRSGPTCARIGAVARRPRRRPAHHRGRAGPLARPAPALPAVRRARPC